MMMQATSGQGGGMAGALFSFFPIVAIFVIFYLIVMRPQQRQMKAHRDRVAAVKKGEEVVTGGGIRGRVTKVTDDEVEVEIAQGVKVKVVKSTISQVLTPNTKPAND